MKNKIIRYMSLILVSTVIGGTSAYFYKTHQIENKNIASFQFNQGMYDELKLVEKYLSNIENVIYEERFNFAFKSFLEKKDIKYVEKKISKNIYTLDELGFEQSLYCNITIVFGDKNKIICEKGGKNLIVLEEFKPDVWSCTFNNDMDLKPLKCLNEQEVLVQEKLEFNKVNN